jgi:hypothetical protein
VALGGGVRTFLALEKLIDFLGPPLNILKYVHKVVSLDALGLWDDISLVRRLLLLQDLERSCRVENQELELAPSSW